MLLTGRTSVILPGKSRLQTAILPDTANLFSGYSTAMKLNEILARVERRLAATEQSADAVSRAAGKPDAIRNMKRAVKEGRSGVTSGTISALAPVLKTSAAWLLEEEGPEEVTDTSAGSPRSVRRNKPDATGNRIDPDLLNQIPGSKLTGERDLPVFATSQGGKGAIIVSSDPIDWVARPEPLARVKDGYGIIISEDSMAPELRAGDIALVNPHLPPRSGDTCVFRSHQPDGTILSRTKFLRRQTADSWHVSEWNSDDDGKKRDFTLKKAEWQVCHVTVGKYSRS